MHDRRSALRLRKGLRSAVSEVFREAAVWRRLTFVL